MSIKVFCKVSTDFFKLFVSKILLQLVAFVLYYLFLSIRLWFLFDLFLKRLNVLLLSNFFLLFLLRLLFLFKLLKYHLLFNKFFLSYFLFIFKITFFLRRPGYWCNSFWTFTIIEFRRQKGGWFNFKVWGFVFLKLSSWSYF